MTAEERAIDVEAANQRLAEMNLEPFTDERVDGNMSMEYASQPLPKPPRRRRSDAGQPKPRPAPAAAPQGPVVGITEEHERRIGIFVQRIREAVLNTQKTQWFEDDVRREFHDYIVSIRAPQAATKAGA